MQIIRGIIPSAQKVLVYGPEGIGKSTFVSQFPDPIFIDTEGSTKHMNVARTPKPSSFQMLLEQVTYFRDNPNELKTLVIDTADWAEKLCSENLCAKNKKKSIEDFGYGKGYVYLMEEFGGLLNLLDELIERNINVVMTAHAKMRKFEQPDEMGAYDRWELKLSKQVAPLLKEWADMVLFANYKTYVVNVDGQGAEKGKNKAQGGTRVMYTTHHPCWDAKNRHNLPPETKFSYEEIAHIFQGNASCSTEKVVESKCENVVQNPIEQSLPERKENVMPEFMTQEQMPVEVQSTLLVLPTGCGKTIVFAKIVEDCVREGRRVLILAHRAELLEQAADKLSRSTGLKCAVEKAEESCLGSWFRVVVGSVQSMQRPKRLQQFERDYFDTIVIDEAHHCISNGYQAVLQYFSEADILGVTATPDRGDMRNLGSYFENLAYEYTLPKAIKEGYLVPIKSLTIPLKIDMSGVGMQSGDFKAGDIGTVLDPYLQSIADEMIKYCMDRKTVVFLPLVKTSQKFCQILNEKGFAAAEVNGNSQDREEILSDYENGKYNVLCNSMLLTEGWDCPEVDCVIVLRPTKVRSLYCQMVGRGTRLYPGKNHLLLLDFLWHTERHELCHPASLICENEDVARQMTKNMEEEPGIAIDIEEAERSAAEDVVVQREEALAKQLSEMKKRKKKLVDPLQFEMSIQAEDLSGYIPSFGWEMSPPSDKQKKTLEKLGIMPDEIENAGKAAKLLDRLDKRRAEGLTTPKQIRFLEGRGFQHVGTWKFETAKNLIDRIAGNGWRIPRDINPQEYKGA